MKKAIKQFTIATFFYAVAMTVYLGSVETQAPVIEINSSNYLAQVTK